MIELKSPSTVTFNWFRRVAYIEGWSYLLLLGVAMPLKYLAGFALAVKIVGAIHGVLFVKLALLGLLVMYQYQKDTFWIIKAFVASILPFGTFYMEKTWCKEELELN